jgi:hypothetical protein
MTYTATMYESEIADMTGVAFDDGRVVKKYHLLTESEKRTARENAIEHLVPDDWYEEVYDYAIETARDLGIEISNRGPFDADIFFTMHSQGSGACFTGNWYYRKGMAARAKQHDAEIQRIAAGLADAARRSFYLTSARVSLGYSLYTHSGTMNIEVFVERGAAVEDEIRQLLRDFADWIYYELTAKYDYLTSDAVIDEQLADQWFDEYGELTS